MILVVSNNKNNFKIPDEKYWRGQKPVVKLILDKIKKGNNVLEIGIGKGGVPKLLLKKEPYINITGFDINKKLLKRTEKSLKILCKGKLKILKLSQDINLAKKFGKERFDFVISSGVLDYAKNPDNVIKNVKDILKHKGYFAFTLFDNLSTGEYDGKSSMQSYTSKIGIKTWGYRDFYIKKILEKLGFKICSIKLFKKLHKNRSIELSNNEIKAIKQNLDNPFDDHFVILAQKK